MHVAIGDVPQPDDDLHGQTTGVHVDLTARHRLVEFNGSGEVVKPERYVWTASIGNVEMRGATAVEAKKQLAAALRKLADEIDRAKLES